MKSPAALPDKFSKGANAVTAIPANPITVPSTVIHFIPFHIINVMKIVNMDPEHTKSKLWAIEVRSRLQVQAEKWKPRKIPLIMIKYQASRHIVIKSSHRFFHSGILIKTHMRVEIYKRQEAFRKGLSISSKSKAVAAELTDNTDTHRSKTPIVCYSVHFILLN